MLDLLAYLLIGIGVTGVAVLDDLIVAKTNGFDPGDYLDWYNERRDLYTGTKEWLVLSIIWGLLVWPFRILDFVEKQDDRFEAYEAYLKQEEEES